MKFDNYQERINNPEIYPSIQNSDGSRSTHKMAVEVDENGDWYAFPTIVQLDNGTLYEFKDNYQALRYNQKINNFKFFGKDKKAALHYGKNYKKGTKLEK